MESVSVLTVDEVNKSQSSTLLPKVVLACILYGASPSVGEVQNITFSDKRVHVAALANIPKANENSVLENARNRAMKMNITSPEQWSLDRGNDLLRLLQRLNIKTEFVNPSHEGGLVVEFLKSDAYYLVEIFNDEDIVFLRRANERMAWDLTEDNFIQKIEQELS